MKIYGKVWSGLTDGEKKSAIDYAAYRTKIRWVRRNVLGHKKCNHSAPNPIDCTLKKI